MKKTVLCLILLLCFAPIALAGMEYDPIKDRWVFVPNTDEETEFKTPEDEWSYRDPERTPPEEPEQRQPQEPEQMPPQEPEQIPQRKPEEMPPKRPMGVPLHVLPRPR